MRKESGQTLLEVLVALGIAVIVISAIVVTTITSLNNAQFTKNQKNATALAQQGIETMRQLRDNNANVYNSLFGSCGGDYCLGGTDTFPHCATPSQNSACGPNATMNNTDFSREVTLVNNASDCNVNANTCPDERPGYHYIHDANGNCVLFCPYGVFPGQSWCSGLFDAFDANGGLRCPSTVSVVNNIPYCASPSDAFDANGGLVCAYGVFYDAVNRPHCNAAAQPVQETVNPATKITVKVSWADQQCVGGTYCHNVTLVSCLSGADQNQNL